MGNILDKRDKSIVVSPSGKSIDKINRYKWAREHSPGVLRYINKNLLNIDGEYQRDAKSQDVIREIAAEWDWALFLVLLVAKRSDGTYWVVDGGHRTRASFYRSDITELPCLVFELGDVEGEARTFIAAAKKRNTISTLAAFKAAVVAVEPTALATKRILDAEGLSIAHTPKAHQLKCVGAVYSAVSIDEALAVKVLSLTHAIADDQPIAHEVFRGLFALAKRFGDHDVLAENEERLRSFSQAECIRAIKNLKAECGKGGDVVFAKAILILINKGKRTRKLEW